MAHIRNLKRVFFLTKFDISAFFLKKFLIFFTFLSPKGPLPKLFFRSDFRKKVAVSISDFRLLKNHFRDTPATHPACRIRGGFRRPCPLTNKKLSFQTLHISD